MVFGFSNASAGLIVWLGAADWRVVKQFESFEALCKAKAGFRFGQKACFRLQTVL